MTSLKLTKTKKKNSFQTVQVDLARPELKNKSTLRQRPSSLMRHKTKQKKLLKKSKAPNKTFKDNKGLQSDKFLKTQEGQKKFASYTEQLKIYIEQNKRYPRAAVKLRQTGIVKLKVTILKNGFFKNIQILEKSKFKNLNQGAVTLLTQLNSFKKLPKEFSKEQDFIVPIVYKLKR